LLLAARHNSAVFVGRGAHLLLPRERGFAIQILAPLEQRIRGVMQRERLSRSEAQAYLRKKDRERRDFVPKNFRRDVTDPHLYDLIVNLEYFDIEWAVDLIVRSVQRRFGRNKPTFARDPSEPRSSAPLARWSSPGRMLWPPVGRVGLARRASVHTLSWAR
jgi:cytidylate kinase